MDFQDIMKLLVGRQSYLWAGLSTAIVFIVLKKNGYTDGLENSVITGVIAGGVFAGCLLASSGVGAGIEQVRSFHRARKSKEAADAAAFRVFDDPFSEHRIALQYIATEIGRPNFKAWMEKDLLAMVDMGLLELDGPGTSTSSATYYKVRDVIWKRMVDEGWLEMEKWGHELPPWDEQGEIIM
jgi:hypothetical protein